MIVPCGVGARTDRMLVTGGSRLSEGTIIHAAVQAQVLGVNLVRLEARIEAAPAQLAEGQRRPPALDVSTGATAPAPPDQYAEYGRHLPPAGEPVTGSRLVQAVDLLRQGAASLAAPGELPPVDQRPGERGRARRRYS
jgi:hypothetical protein